MVAAGGWTRYYEDGVHVWDWAAGALIAAEAGATLRLPPADGSPGWSLPRRPASPTRCARRFAGPGALRP